MTTARSYLADAASLLRVARRHLATQGSLTVAEWDEERAKFLEEASTRRVSNTEIKTLVDSVLGLLLNAQLDPTKVDDPFLTPETWERQRDEVYIHLASSPADGGRRLTRARTVLGEMIKNYPEPDGVIYHLPDRTLDFERTPDFAPVVCGGGLVLPPRTETRPEADVCPDCLAGRKTL